MEPICHFYISVIVACLIEVTGGIPVRSNATETLKVLTQQVSKELKIDYNHSKYAGIKPNQLTAELIKPPDHLEGLPMERDGKLNKQYRNEVFLGTKASEVNHGDKDETLLREVFRKVDTNNDGYMSTLELQRWIAEKVKEHYSRAVQDNFWIFSALDKNHDGRVSWNEYHVNFMLEQGFDEKYAKDHPEDHKMLDRKLKEKILLDKAAWYEAANSDPDALNIDEFLTFRHPEHSHVSLMGMVNDIISNLDDNGDEHLSEKEFAQLTPDETSKRTKDDWKRERIAEFRDHIDLNHDGKASRQELLMYNDPENPVHAKREAKELVFEADSNGDGLLSLEEVLAKKEVFLGSKMVNTARNIHDEF
ncbi:45 kDa calcium-binding protein-like [Ornithodoros turicata]|uniref:45 kDa calcium-binding protein-like n=1 Tax=Ornithodoros turicata TaxID=34597 RepID=UPI003139993C